MSTIFRTIHVIELVETCQRENQILEQDNQVTLINLEEQFAEQDRLRSQNEILIIKNSCLQDSLAKERITGKEILGATKSNIALPMEPQNFFLFSSLSSLLLVFIYIFWIIGKS